MQNEEKNKLEERIIAHFDGSLSGEESNSLLREVSSNVEARALFKSYETLTRVISASRVPMELPAAARTSIAERIPGLLAFIPGLIGTVETLPVLTQSANPFVAFFTKMSLSTAVSIGTSAVVLTTAGVIVKNKIDDNAATQKAKAAVVQSRSSAKTSAPMYAVLPGHDVTTPNFNAGENVAWSGERLSNVSNGASGVASSITHTSYRRDNASAVPNNSRNAASASGDNPTEPPALIATAASPLPVSPVAANIPDFRPTSLASLPMLLAGELPIRPFVSMGTRVQFMSADHSISGLTQNSSGLGYDIRAGFDIGLTNDLGLRIQGGQMQIAHLVDRSGSSSQDPWHNSGGTQQWIEYSTISLANAYWTTLGVTYQVYASDAVPLTFSLNGGAAFLDKTSPMGEIGLSTEMAVSNHLLIRPALTFDAVWTSAEDVRGGTPGTAVLVDRRFDHPSSIWSTSLGINIGFQYHF